MTTMKDYLMEERDRQRRISPAYNLSRNLAICLDRQLGFTFRAIGEKHGITAKRVMQIVEVADRTEKLLAYGYRPKTKVSRN